jgi:hypothetical protein
MVIYDGDGVVKLVAVYARSAPRAQPNRVTVAVLESDGYGVKEKW